MGDGRGYRRCSKVVHGTRKDAFSEKARLQSLYEGAERTLGPVTFGRAYSEWWEPRLGERVERGELSEHSSDLYRKTAIKHVLARWKDVPTDAIRPIDYEEWRASLTKSQANIASVVMRGVLDECRKREVPVSGALEISSYRKPRENEIRGRGIYRLEEIDAILWAIRDSPIARAVALMALGSCRTGEGLAVSAEDVFPYEARGMTVACARVTCQVSAHEEIVPKLKNRQSERIVVIPEPWSIWFLDGAPETGLLTERLPGEPMGRDRANRIWRRALPDGVERHPLRNLRNSWRTFMRHRQKIDRDVLEKMMGHAGKGVGEVHYDRPDYMEFADTVAESFRLHPFESQHTWD